MEQGKKKMLEKLARTRTMKNKNGHHIATNGSIY
jgi:hypothetical protein